MIDPKSVVALVQSKAELLRHNHEMLDIFHGNLLPYVDAELKAQLSPQSYWQAKFRIMPINVLPKVIDKLTKIYQTAVVREVKDGQNADKELLDWYSKQIMVNKQMNCSNELFNLCKNSLIYPYVHNGKPKLRVILNDRFVLHSDDPVCPEKPTEVILLAGKKNGKDLFWVYSADQFYVCNSEEKIDYEEMLRLGNPEGINPYGILPFVYVNQQDDYKLNPTPDTDILRITKVIPVMLSDLNLAAMFQAFSIIYGIDLDDENMKFAPNSFWKFKSNPENQTKPEIGTIKPQVDFSEVLQLIQSQFSMWLGTKGIKASGVGEMSPDNFASGLSKIIDEMDTYEARHAQITYYQPADEQLWRLIFDHMHPVWIQNQQIENTQVWTAGAYVSTKFAGQTAPQQRGQLVKDLKEEYAAGFTTRKAAVMRLNPQLTEMEVDQLILEIDEERTAYVEPESQNQSQTEGQETPEEETDDPNQREEDTEEEAV